MSETTLKDQALNPNVKAREMIICPVLRGAVAEERLPVGGDGVVKIADLKDVQQAFGMMRATAYVAVFANRFLHIAGNLLFGRFNVRKMREGLIKHSCDSGIISEGHFNEEKFDELAGFASEEGRFTKAAFDRAVQHRKSAEGGSALGAWLSRLEFSILLSTFGTEGEDNQKFITVKALRELYEHKKLPWNMKIEGKLVHEEASYTGIVSGVKVELWHRRTILRDRHIASYEATNRKGRFCFLLAGAQKLNLQLRIIDTRGIISPNRDKILCVIDGRNGLNKSIDLGALRVPLWEYDRSYPFPMAKVSSYDGKLPQKFSPGVMQGIFLTNVRLRFWLFLRKWFVGFGSLSLRQVQDSFETKDKRTRQNQDADSDEYFVYRVVNGFNPAELREVAAVEEEDEECADQGACNWVVKEPLKAEETDGAKLYVVEYDFKKYESDKLHDLNSAKLCLKLQGDELLPMRIIIKLRKKGRKTYNKCYSVTPGHALWPAAKRAFRTTWAAAGELDAHLGIGHLNVGQYAIAAYRNFYKNPLGNLLLPFLRGVTNINDLGKTSIFGVNGVLTNTTALTTSAAWIRLTDKLGTQDWRDWKPPEAVYQGHVYAHAAALFWEVVTECVDEYFEKHAAEIEAHWYEVYRFSQDLVDNSVARDIGDTPSKEFPWFQPRVVTSRSDLVYYSLQEDDGDAQYLGDANDDDGTGGYGKTRPRARVFRPVTVRDELADDNNKVQEIKNLKQVCCYAIYHATMWHGWSNDLQITDVGNVFYAPLALRNGTMKNDDTVLPTPDEAAAQIMFANLLTDVKIGFIMWDRLDEIDPCFSECLGKKRADFWALRNQYEPDETFDVDTIRSRTNI